MAIIRDDAVVLMRFDYSETSQVIVLFTRDHGKVRAIAKGIRRGTKARFAAGIDLLDVGNVVVSCRQERSSSLATVTEWKQTRSLSGLRERLFRIHGAQYAAEITGHLTEDWDPHTELFDALVSTLMNLSASSEPLAITLRYQLRLLKSVGSLPRFDTCVLCGRADDLTHFSSSEGGLVCRNCEPVQIEKHELSPHTLGTLKVLASRGLQDARPGKRGFAGCAQTKTFGCLAGAFGVLNYHITHLMGRESVLASKLVPARPRRGVE